MTETSAEAFWEDHYQARDRVWSGRVNPVLATMVESRTPGDALDLGCGEGADAVWLARSGWRVTATDISATALERARAAAESAGVSEVIDWQRHDFADSFPTGTFDLVSAQFLQTPIDFPRERVLQSAAKAVAPGGLLLIVSHAAFPPWSQHHDDDVHFPTAQETLDSLDLEPDDWRIDRVETAEREATGPDGTVATLYDAIVALTRLA